MNIIKMCRALAVALALVVPFVLYVQAPKQTPYLTSGMLTIEETVSQVREELRDSAEHYWLALAMFYEARSEPDVGIHVADVVINRALDTRWPNTIEAVVRQGENKQGCQFSFMCDGKPEAPEKVNPELWHTISAVALEKLARHAVGVRIDSSEGAHSYYATYLHDAEWWQASAAKRYFERFEPTKQVGKHILLADAG